jgi:hypothetical protein
VDFLGHIRGHWGHYRRHRIEDLVVISANYKHTIYFHQIAHSGKGSYNRSSLDTPQVIGIDPHNSGPELRAICFDTSVVPCLGSSALHGKCMGCLL